jgi:cytochrome c553
MKLWRLVAVAAGISMSASAFSGGNADAGASKAVVCTACHGPNGNSTNPEWPNLAGQGERYVAEQLKFFKEGKRNNPVMQPMASTLSDQDMADLGAYFATQKSTGLEADPSYWEAGQKLYRSGDAERNVPACIACHGPVGRGNPPAAYPALRSQHSVYTQKQLNDYASGARPGANAEIMRTIASRLTADEIRNVSSYIQGMR